MPPLPVAAAALRMRFLRPLDIRVRSRERLLPFAAAAADVTARILLRRHGFHRH